MKRVKIALLFNDKYKQGYSYIMTQYTSTGTSQQGATVVAVLDATSSNITYTVTGTTGLSATITIPASENPQSTAVINSIRQQFAAQNGGSFLNLGIGGFGQALSQTQGTVNTQAKKAETVATATGEPPPAAPAAIPVTPETNPNPTPALTSPPIDNATVPATGQNAAADAAFQEANASPQQVIDPNSDPNTNIGTEGQDVTGFEPLQEPPSTADEFDGIDTQVANNENGLQEPPLLSDEEINQQIQQAGQDETITSPDSITENVFDPRQEVTENVFDPRQEVTENVFDPTSGGAGGSKGLQGSTDAARAQQITQDAENAKTQGDWRVRLSLAPSAGYLYKAQNPGILAPLQKTDGVIFPYLPQIQVTYAAHYDPSDLTHSNYKIFQYKNSSVDQVSITCDFTAQDTEEANYMLAVIHFFRSVTKMFYGQDQIPKPGTPPPLCYLSGMGDFQFDRHPLAISSFNYSLPNDVDYIRASSPTLLSGVNSTGYNDNRNSDLTPSQVRMQSGTNHLNAGAKESAPNFGKATNTQPTYVPTKISISLMAYPIVTRNDVSNNFSLEKYATGALLQGRKNPGGGGIW